jgi:hypothetical protein
MPSNQELHPFIRPPDGHVPASPIRDDNAIGDHEDLDREPDGIPHSTVGLTYLFSVMLAALVAIMFVAGGTVVRVAAVMIPVLAIPVLVGSLNKQARRERNRLHPSR